MRITLFTDGAARGNPGPAAIGIVLVDSRGREVVAFGETIGRATNNEAEYRALLSGLQRASDYSKEIEVRTDSELLARQLKGSYRVRAENLRILHEQAQIALARFKSVQITIIPRTLNKRADALANQALDGPVKEAAESKIRAPKLDH